MKLDDLVSYLDDYLDIAAIPDWKNAYNGLQVDGRVEVSTVATAVDACKFTIDRAIEASADMLLVHHGLFWGSTAPLTGMYYKRMAALIKNDLSLYSSHTPLDAHPEVGNNHVLARDLELNVIGRFGKVEGIPLGVISEGTMPLAELTDRIRGLLGVNPLTIAKGPANTRIIGIITGGAGGYIEEARESGCDTLITGEGPHHSYFDAEELGVNVILAGHYVTETVGVKALGEHVKERFGLDTMFIDHPTGL